MRQDEAEVRLDWCPPIPENLFDHYKLGGYEKYQVARIANKYLSRKVNIKRAWARIHCHFPETLNANIPLDILEFSTAHGAMLEIWRHFGHRVQGTDFQDWPDGYRRKLGIPKWLEHDLEDRHSNKRSKKNLGWIYQPIIESAGLDVDLFDAGSLPYFYKSNSFDVVCCYQAIEAYAHPKYWCDILAEFCRIARATVVLGFNSPPAKLRDDKDYLDAVQTATEAIRSNKEFGFRTVFLEFGNTRAGYHPTAVKLMAV